MNRIQTFKQFIEGKNILVEENAERYLDTLNNATTAEAFATAYVNMTNDDVLKRVNPNFIAATLDYGTRILKLDFFKAAKQFNAYLDIAGRKRAAALAVTKLSNEDDIKQIQSSVVAASKRQKAVTQSTFAQYLDYIGERLKNPNSLQKLKQISGKVLDYLNNAAIAVQSKKADGTTGEITYRLKGLDSQQRALLAADEKPYYNKARRIMRQIRNQLSFNKLKVQSYSNDYIAKRQAISAAARRGSPSQYIRKNQNYYAKYKTTNPDTVKGLAEANLKAGMEKSLAAGYTKIESGIENVKNFSQDNVNSYKAALKDFSNTFKANKYTAAEIKKMFDDLQAAQ